MDVDRVEGGSQAGTDAPDEPWMQTRAGKRISELQQVEENVAALLHFAGCTLAALHPDPLSSFTSREIAVEDDDDDDAENGAGAGAPKRPKKPTPRNAEEAKLAEFGKYAEGYYATLNDVQLALRTSIRHLRVSRVSSRPLTDPAYASLAYRQPASSSSAPPGSNQSGADSVRVGPGGVALDLDVRLDELRKQESTGPAWGSRSARLPAGDADSGDPSSGASALSVDALELERDALRDLVAALESRKGSESA